MDSNNSLLLACLSVLTDYMVMGWGTFGRRCRSGVDMR